MSSKSVLGDDPFETSPGSAAAAPAGQVKKESKRATAAGLPGSEEPASDRPSRKKSTAAEKPAAPEKVRVEAGSAAMPTQDGAAARRAARATASMDTVRITPPAAEADGSRQPLIRRPGAALQPLQGGALERAGGSYRRWITELRMRTRSETVDDFGYDPIFAERWQPLLEFLYRSYWRVESSGIENIPDHDQAMIVSNHAGAMPYDGAMIMSAVKYDHPAHREVRPLLEDFIFHFPFLGVALNRIGCVRACPENAERLLRHGSLVAVFPEGIKGISKLFSNRYQLQRFGRGGFIKLALQTRTPIIPAAVIGSEEIHPMLGRLTWLTKYLGIPYVPLTPTFPWLGPLGTIPLPTKWQIRFGEPLDLASQYGPAAAQDRVLVHRLTEQVRSTIQGMVDEALLSRRSVLFG